MILGGTGDLMQHVCAALLCVLLLGPLTAHAGYLIVDQNGEQVLLSTGRLEDGALLAGGIVMVLDVGRARLWIADPGGASTGRAPSTSTVTVSAAWPPCRRPRWSGYWPTS